MTHFFMDDPHFALDRLQTRSVDPPAQPGVLSEFTPLQAAMKKLQCVPARAGVDTLDTPPAQLRAPSESVID